jgi:hypothetical protein
MLGLIQVAPSPNTIEELVIIFPLGLYSRINKHDEAMTRAPSPGEMVGRSRFPRTARARQTVERTCKCSLLLCRPSHSMAQYVIIFPPSLVYSFYLDHSPPPDPRCHYSIPRFLHIPYSLCPPASAGPLPGPGFRVSRLSLHLSRPRIKVRGCWVPSGQSRPTH